MKLSRKTLVIGAVAVAILATGVVVAIAQDEDEREPLPNAKPVVGSVSDELASTIAAFDRARTDDDVLPSNLGQFVAQGRPEGANSDLSRKALVRGGRAIYLLPGQDKVCLIIADTASGGGIECHTIDAVRIGNAPPGKTMTGCQPPEAGQPPVCSRIVLTGVVPNGVEQVTLELVNGKTITSPVEQGAYLIDTDTNPAPATLNYNGPDGRVTYQLEAQ